FNPSNSGHRPRWYAENNTSVCRGLRKKLHFTPCVSQSAIIALAATAIRGSKRLVLRMTALWSTKLKTFRTLRWFEERATGTKPSSEELPRRGLRLLSQTV